MPILPFGWKDHGPPDLDATNLEAANSHAGAYTDELAAKAGAVSGLATLDGEQHLTSSQVPPSVVSSSTEPGSLGLEAYSTGVGNALEWSLPHWNVQALGVKPTETGSKPTEKLLAKINALLGEGIRSMAFYFPGGLTYHLALGTIGEEALEKGVAIVFRGDGPFAARIAPASAEEPLVTTTGAADGTNVGLSLDNIGVELIAHRPYNKPVFQNNFGRKFSLNRVGLICNNFTATIFSHESSYEMSWRDVYVRGGKFALPFVHTNELFPVNQPAEYQTCDNFVFERVTVEVMGPVYRNSKGNVHGILSLGLKGQQSVYYPKGGSLLTTLAKAAEVGETTLELAEAGASVGDFIIIGHDALGHSADYARVTAVSGVNVTIANPLLFAHAIGACVQNGGAYTTLGDNIQGATIIAPHMEHYTSAILLGSTTNVSLIDPYITSSYGIMRCGNDKHTSVSGNIWMLGTERANKLEEKSADNPGSSLGETQVTGQVNEATGAEHEANALPSSATAYTATLKDTKGSNTIRRNIGSAGGEAVKDRAYEVTANNAILAQIQYSGRGFFKDLVSVGDLGNITGKTSKELDEALTVSPNDTTQVAGSTLLATAELSGSQIVLTRKTGAGNLWQVSNPYTPLSATVGAKQRGTLEARGVLLPMAAGGNPIPSATAALSEANRAFLHRAFAQRAGKLKHIYVWGGATEGGKTRVAVFDAGEAENEHITVLWESAEVEIKTKSEWVLMGEPELAIVENQQLVLGVMNSGTTQLFGKIGSAPVVGAANELPTVFLPDSPGVSPKLLSEHKYGSLSFGGAAAHLADTNMETSATTAAYAILGHIE